MKKTEQLCIDGLAELCGDSLLSCSFTGHRTILPEHRRMLEDRLERALEYLFSRGCRVFYCGGAIGFDTLAARAVIKFSLTHEGVRLRLVLPCQNQDEKWNDSQKSEYAYIMKHAELTEYISDEYTPDCMRKRNKRLVALADVLVAYIYRSRSGAGQTVRMAENDGKIVYNLAPAATSSENT